MLEEVKDLAVINIKEIATTMQNAGEILTKNENLVNAAIKGGQEIIDTIEAEGMTDELDAAANEWQVKNKKAVEIANTRRSPITQVMTKMAKFFTELEGKLDAKKSGTVAYIIQEKRNAHATAKARKAKEDQDKIIRQQNVANEKISLTAEINTQIRAIYNDKLFAFKKFVTDTYNKLTLENIEEIKEAINKVSVNYPLDKWNLIHPTLFANYLKEEEIKELVSEIREKLYDECSANFRENMEAQKIETLDLIPSRINELKAIAKSSVAEKKRLEAEAENRKRAQEAQTLANKKKREEEDAKRIEANKKMQTAGSLFNSSAALQQVKDTASSVKEGVKIKVLDTDGLAAIFMFYFEKEGRGLTVEDLSKKTLLQMITFSEKKAFKDNELIDSLHIEYENVYKAKVTK